MHTSRELHCNHLIPPDGKIFWPLTIYRGVWKEKTVTLRPCIWRCLWRSLVSCWAYGQAGGNTNGRWIWLVLGRESAAGREVEQASNEGEVYRWWSSDEHLLKSVSFIYSIILKVYYQYHLLDASRDQSSGNFDHDVSQTWLSLALVDCVDLAADHPGGVK